METITKEENDAENLKNVTSKKTKFFNQDLINQVLENKENDVLIFAKSEILGYYTNLNNDARNPRRIMKSILKTALNITENDARNITTSKNDSIKIELFKLRENATA